MDVRDAQQVAIGAVAGAAARWATGEMVASTLGTLLIVNGAGAFVFGLVTALHRHDPPHPRLWLGIGFCGALTTFSSLAVEIASLLDAGRPGDATVTTVLTLAVGLAAAYAGDRSVGPVVPRR